jgi:hypothetical protein
MANRKPPALEGVPRLWLTIGVPGIVEEPQSTYWALPLDEMPPVGQALAGTLDWLVRSPSHEPSLQQGPDDPAERDATSAELEAVAPNLHPPAAFRRFIADAEPRRHIRSATACYLDLGHFAVVMEDGGTLVHFLSDQQWVLHWLMYSGADGSEAVVVSSAPLGFDDGETRPLRQLDRQQAVALVAVCSDSFEEFIYRFWIENELWFRLAKENVSLQSLPDDLLIYASGYPRDQGSSWPWV